MDDAWVACPQANERILLRKCGSELVIAFEMALVEHFNGILLTRPSMPRQHDLWQLSATPYIAESGPLRTLEYDPSPNILPNSKSSTLSRPLTELLRDRDGPREGDDIGRNSDGLSSSSSEIPSSLVRYAGALEPRGVRGDPGLLERIGRWGDENVRIGRGRTGVWMVRSEVELELEDEEMTEAFLLRSARLGCCSRLCGSSWLLASGEGAETRISGIPE